MSAMKMAEDTRKLLRAGGAILLCGVVAVVLVKFAFGGVGKQGPHTNAGWLALMVAMGCLPMGTILTALGAAKWMGGRK